MTEVVLRKLNDYKNVILSRIELWSSFFDTLYGLAVKSDVDIKGLIGTFIPIKCFIV